MLNRRSTWLGIPAGKIDIQRLFYWHVCKAFYNPAYDFEATNHINFDWFAPANSHRQSPEDVHQWCHDASFEIAREHVDDAGIFIIALCQCAGNAN
jgi:arsenite methyltransferase